MIKIIFLQETPLVRTFTAKNNTFTEQYINYKKEVVKNDILKKLGMTKAPNISMHDMPPIHLIRQMMKKYARTKRDEVEVDEDHFQTRILNIHGQDGTGIVPSNITNEGHEIQYFDLNVAQLRDLHWPDVVSANMFLHLPAAPLPTDLKVWIDIRKVVLPQPSDIPFAPLRNELLCQLFMALR